MSNLNVTFLGKAYSLPEDILVYIDLLDFANSVQAQLMAAFSRKLGQSDSGFVTDQDFADDINQQVKKFIGKLCDYGIFNRTVNDYLKENKGYQLISDVNKEAFSKSIDLLKREMESWKAGYEDAMYKKESSVTGMGFSIWSGSLINHALYAAMQASTLDKQEKAASKQYQKDMDALQAKLDSQFGDEKSKYINNVYIPHMETATMAFAYELLDRYLSDLITNHKFDAEALKYVDVERSNDLLDNLSLSDNKKAILERAFVACPFNFAVYQNVLKYNLLDYESFQTAKYFRYSDRILAELQQSWGNVDYPSSFHINYQRVRQWAICIGKTPVELLRSLTESYAAEVVKAYKNVADMLLHTILCKGVMQECPEATILDNNTICGTKAHKCVKSIVSSDVWNQLLDKCGHTDLLDRIKEFAPSDTTVERKADIDTFLINKLTHAFELARLEIVDDIEKRKEKEKLHAEEQIKESLRIQAINAKIRKEKKKSAIRITISVLVAITCLVLWVKLAVPAIRYQKAEKQHQAGQYEDAVTLYSLLGNYKDSQEKIKESQYCFAIELMEAGQSKKALVLFDLLNNYKDAIQYGATLRSHIVKRNTIAIDFTYAAAIQADGTVIVTGDYSDPRSRAKEWNNIIDIALCGKYIVGLQSDGTVVVAGDVGDNISDVSSWQNVVAVEADDNYVIGLCADGTVLIAGSRYNMSEWTDIIQVELYGSRMIGLKSDGSVIDTSKDDTKNVSNWTDIVYISASNSHTIGVHSDGTVVSTYVSGYYRHNVSEWTDIVTATAGYDYTIGIKSDGTVVATGDNLYNQCNADGWIKVADVVVDGDYVIGIRYNGAIATTGRNTYTPLDAISRWKNIKLPE